jgi:hypothetical protein
LINALPLVSVIVNQPGKFKGGQALPSSPKNKIRFGIGEDGNRYSEIWKLWCNRSDVYLTSKAFGGRIKLSLHQSGVCQYAFSKDFFDKSADLLKPAFPDRTWERWHRRIAIGKDIVHAATVIFSSSEEWNAYDVSGNVEAVLLPPPPHGYCFEICLMFSAIPHSKYANPGDAVPMREFVLDSGEFLSVWTTFSKLPNDYFDFQKIGGGIVEFGPVLAGKGSDVRGISVVHLTRTDDGPLRIHSSHNMRLVTVKKGSKIPVYRRKLAWWDGLGLLRRLLPPRAK